LETVPQIAGDTVAITLVAYAVSVSLAMIYADKHGYSIDPNQVNTVFIIKVIKCLSLFTHRGCYKPL